MNSKSDPVENWESSPATEQTYLKNNKIVQLINTKVRDSNFMGGAKGELGTLAAQLSTMNKVFITIEKNNILKALSETSQYILYF